MNARNRADSDLMSDDGDRVKSRRERLGLDKRHLAELAGISRETLAAIENGQGFRRSTLTKIERVLTDLENEAGLAPEPPATTPDEAAAADLVTFRLPSGMGDVVVSGPVSDLEALTAAVERLLRGMGHSEDPPR